MEPLTPPQGTPPTGPWSPEPTQAVPPTPAGPQPEPPPWSPDPTWAVPASPPPSAPAPPPAAPAAPHVQVPPPPGPAVPPAPPAPPLPPTGGGGHGGPPGDDGEERRLRTAVVAAAVAVSLALVVLAFVLVSSGDDDVATGDTTTTTEVGSTTSAPTTTTTAPTTTAPSTTTPTTLAPGTLDVQPRQVDLGASARAVAVQVLNPGGQPVRFAVTTSDPAVTVSVRTGTVDPGARQGIEIGLVRDALDEGPVEQSVTIDAGASGRVTVRVVAVVARPPTVEDAAADADAIHASCDATDDRTTVTATVGDDTAVETVELVSEGPANGRTVRPMEVDGDTASGQLGPFGTPETVSWRVRVVDVFGNEAVSDPQDLTIQAC